MLQIATWVISKHSDPYNLATNYTVCSGLVTSSILQGHYVNNDASSHILSVGRVHRKKALSSMSSSMCLTKQVCCISELIQPIAFNVDGSFRPQQHRVLSPIDPHSALDGGESGSIQRKKPRRLFERAPAFLNGNTSPRTLSENARLNRQSPWQ